MKKMLSYMLILLITMTFLLPVYAAFDNPPIIDDAGYLTQSELEELSMKLDKVRENYNFEVAIFTESDMTSDTAEASADDIYDFNGYGAGENDDGILLYICSDTREYHITTHGMGLRYFNSNGLEYIESKVAPCLTENDYYEAFEAYIEASEELLQMAKDGKPYNEKQHSTKYLVGVILVCLTAPLLIAFWLMKRKLKKMKTAVSNDYAVNYVKPGSMRIDTSRDLFLYSRITKTEKTKSSSDTHTSSSGRTHGGRGGSF